MLVFMRIFCYVDVNVIYVVRGGVSSVAVGVCWRCCFDVVRDGY